MPCRTVPNFTVPYYTAVPCCTVPYRTVLYCSRIERRCREQRKTMPNNVTNGCISPQSPNLGSSIKRHEVERSISTGGRIPA